MLQTIDRSFIGEGIIHARLYGCLLYTSCRHMQVLEWENLKYSDDFSRVDYLCANEECHAQIEESSKSWMLANGEWRSHCLLYTSSAS